MQKKYIYILLFFAGITIMPSYGKKATKKETEKTIPKSIELSVTDQRKFDYYYYEAINSKVLGDYNASYDYLNYCFQIDSTNSAVLFELGNFYNTLEQKSKALSFYKKAVSYNDNIFYYKSALGALYLELQQYSEAVDIYESLVAQKPGEADLYLFLSESYRLDGDLPKAIEALDNVEKIVGLNEKISIQKFQLYSALDNKKRAYAEFEKYIEKYPREVKYYVLLGNIYLSDDKQTEAYNTLLKAKSIDSDNPYLITSLANYYEKAGRKDDAERELHTALLSQKLDIDAKLDILTQFIGTLQNKEGDTQRANSLLDTLMVEHPQETKLNLMYGNLLMLQKKPNEAQSHFRLFAESEPSNPMGWEQLLRSIPTDSVDESIKVCQTAISYNPNDILFYFYLGVGEYQKKNYNKALSSLNTGILKASPDDNPVLLSEFYGMAGSIYYEINKSDSAFISFQKALQYNPQNTGVLNNYSYFLSLEKKNLDRAEKMSSITIKAEPTNPTFLDTYGWILFEQGDYVTSKIYLENAVKYSAEKEKKVSGEVLEHYGDVLFKLGRTDEALEYWKKAKEAKTDTDDTKILDKKIETKTYITE